MVYHQDFTGTPTTNSSGAKYDLYGHGTHVAGIIGGNGSLSGGQYEGVAPAVNFVDLRALDQNGAGTDSTVIAAIQEAIALQNTYNIRVINISLGRGIFVSYTQDPLCQAVEAAWKSGIVVVVAAGNYGRLSVNGSNGYGTVTAPGNDPFVLTVGATKSNGSTSASAETLASYSSKGPTTYDHIVKPDMVAPGNDIVSLSAPGATLEAVFPTELVTGTDGNNDYFTLSGTSMATPAVVGAAALLLQEQSTLTPDQVKARLMQTATKMNVSLGLVSTSAYVPHLSQTLHLLLRSVLGWVGIAERAIRDHQHRSCSRYTWAQRFRRPSSTTRTARFRWCTETRPCPHLCGLGNFGGLGHFSGLGNFDCERHLRGLGHFAALEQQRAERLQRGLGLQSQVPPPRPQAWSGVHQYRMPTPHSPTPETMNSN